MSKELILDQVSQDYGYSDFHDAMMNCDEIKEFKNIILSSMAAYATHQTNLIENATKPNPIQR